MSQRHHCPRAHHGPGPRGPRGGLYGRAAAGGQRPVHDAHGHQDALYREGMKSACRVDKKCAHLIFHKCDYGLIEDAGFPFAK